MKFKKIMIYSLVFFIITSIFYSIHITLDNLKTSNDSNFKIGFNKNALHKSGKNPKIHKTIFL